ncbi:hypothetical protein H5410_027339 [Solanum commersonii]|uniref:Uncharacterized protein n=1 Tax=Solanum commersonii TaxID=4109 RepID=A0A9J5Z1Q3_SOLCO|nr:hypothetical protein H5410_027339 [Solanum commersonii]
MNTNVCAEFPSPDPRDSPDSRDPCDPPKASFKDVLLNRERDLNESYLQSEDTNMSKEEHDRWPIILSEEDKQRIYSPWKYAVIGPQKQIDRSLEINGAPHADRSRLGLSHCKVQLTRKYEQSTT